MAKLQKALKPEEFAAAMVNMTNREQRMESLDKQFLELEAHFRSVLEKIAAAPLYFGSLRNISICILNNLNKCENCPWSVA